MAAQTAAASSWFGRRRRLIAVRDRLTPYLRPDAKLKPKDVPAVVESLWRVQTAVQAIASRAATIPGLSVPEGWNPFLDGELLAAEVQWLRRAGAAVDGASAFHVQLRKLIVAGLPAGTAAAEAVGRLRDAVIALLAVCSSSADQLATWAGDDGFVLRWSMTRPERGVDSSVLMSLRRWVSFLDTLEPLRYAGLFDARTLLVTGAVKADDAVRAFDRGLAAASVRERLDAHRARHVRRRGAREGDPPVHRGLAGGARAPDLGAAGAGARVAAVRRGVRLGPGRRAAAGAGQAAPRARRAGAAGAVRRADHLGHAVRAGLAGLGGAVLPRAGRPVRPGRVRRGLADPGRRRGRRARPGQRRRRRG